MPLRAGCSRSGAQEAMKLALSFRNHFADVNKKLELDLACSYKDTRAPLQRSN
jgi:hypothetical protein